MATRTKNVKRIRSADLENVTGGLALNVLKTQFALHPELATTPGVGGFNPTFNPTLGANIANALIPQGVVQPQVQVLPVLVQGPPQVVNNPLQAALVNQLLHAQQQPLVAGPSLGALSSLLGPRFGAPTSYAPSPFFRSPLQAFPQQQHFPVQSFQPRGGFVDDPRGGFSDQIQRISGGGREDFDPPVARAPSAMHAISDGLQQARPAQSLAPRPVASSPIAPDGSVPMPPARPASANAVPFANQSAAIPGMQTSYAPTFGPTAGVNYVSGPSPFMQGPGLGPTAQGPIGDVVQQMTGQQLFAPSAAPALGPVSLPDSMSTPETNFDLFGAQPIRPERFTAPSTLGYYEGESTPVDDYGQSGSGESNRFTSNEGNSYGANEGNSYGANEGNSYVAKDTSNIVASNDAAPEAYEPEEQEPERQYTGNLSNDEEEGAGGYDGLTA